MGDLLRDHCGKLPKIWTQRDGTEIEVTRMSRSHLDNTIALIKRRHKQIRTEEGEPDAKKAYLDGLHKASKQLMQEVSRRDKAAQTFQQRAAFRDPDTDGVELAL